MNKGYRALAIGILAAFAVMAFPGTAAAAQPKRNETVYVKLNHNGQPGSVNSVNWVDIQGKSELNDKTGLKDIKLIPDSLKALIDGDVMKVNLSGCNEKSVFYSGSTDKQLPMNVEIRYFVDGSEVTADKLAGCSGNIEIKMHLKNTTGSDDSLKFKDFKSGNSSSFTKSTYVPFMANVEIDLPLDRFENIDAPDAAVIVVGKVMKLTWLKFPYPDEDITVKMKTEKFELDPISITLIPHMPPLTEIELEGKLSDMYDGVGEMDNKLSLLLNGVDTAKNGSTQLSSGLAKLGENLGKAADAGKQLSAGMPAISAGMGKLSSSAELLVTAQDAQIKMVQNIEFANSELEKAVAVMAKTPGLEKTAAQLAGGLQKQKLLLGLLENGGKLPDGNDFPGLTVTKDGISKMKDGLVTCKAGTDKAMEGITALYAGLDKLNGYTPAIEAGVSGMGDGMTKLGSGLSDFRTLGIQKLQSAIADQINEVRKGGAEKDRVENRVNSYVTFTGDASIAGGSAEFLLQTDSIKAPAEKQAVDSSATAADKSGDDGIFKKIADFIKSIFGGK